MKTTKNNEEKKRKREPHNVSVADRLFRRLQIKFTAIVSAICVALVAICFVAATVANLVNMELSINDALDSALDSSWESLLPDGEEPDAENSSDCAIIIVSGGSVIASSLYTYMDDQTMYSLVNSAARGETDVEYDGRNYRMAMAPDLGQVPARARHDDRGIRLYRAAARHGHAERRAVLRSGRAGDTARATVLSDIGQRARARARLARQAERADSQRGA